MTPEDALRAGSRVWTRWRTEHAGLPDLRGADLQRLDLSGFDLSRCNLHGANLGAAVLDDARLQHCDLVAARLGSASLRRALLHGANLRKTVLYRADLSEAVLTQCHLHRATLDGACLQHADLQFATLSRCTLAGTDLRGARLGGTTISGCDLSRAKNLRRLVHLRPSALATDVLEPSARPLPDDFLIGCGVSEGFVEATRRPSAQTYFSAFISYNHRDRRFARKLFEGLRTQGIRCWLDDHEMAIGADIRDEIDSAIDINDRVLLCCSRHSLESYWVDKEIERALAKEQRLWQTERRRAACILPLDLDGYLFDGWQDSRSADIRNRVAADFRGWQRRPAVFEDGLQRVTRSLAAPSPKGRHSAGRDTIS